MSGSHHDSHQTGTESFRFKRSLARSRSHRPETPDEDAAVTKPGPHADA